MMPPDFGSMNGSHAMPGQIILPPSGLYCPDCGHEPKRLPDGQPTDAAQFRVENVDSPYYCIQCVQKVLIARDAAYVAEHVRPLESKETPNASGAA